MPLWTWPACRLWGAHWSQTRLNDVPNPWSPLVYAGAEPLCVQLWLHWTIIKSNSHSECSSIFTAFNFVRSSVCSPMTSPTRIVVSACDELNFSFAQQRRQPARAPSLQSDPLNDAATKPVEFARTDSTTASQVCHVSRPIRKYIRLVARN